MGVLPENAPISWEFLGVLGEFSFPEFLGCEVCYAQIVIEPLSAHRCIAPFPQGWRLAEGLHRNKVPVYHTLLVSNHSLSLTQIFPSILGKIIFPLHIHFIIHVQNKAHPVTNCGTACTYFC